MPFGIFQFPPPPYVFPRPFKVTWGGLPIWNIPGNFLRNPPPEIPNWKGSWWCNGAMVVIWLWVKTLWSFYFFCKTLFKGSVCFRDFIQQLSLLCSDVLSERSQPVSPDACDTPAKMLMESRPWHVQICRTHFLHQLWINHGCRHSMGCMDTQLPAYYNQTWKPTLQFFLTPIFPPNQDFFLFPLKKFYVPRLASPRFYRWQCRCRLGVNQYSTAKAAGCFCGVNYGQWKLSACFMAMASHLTFTKVKLFPILFPPPAQKPETVKNQRLGCCPKRSK